MPFVIVPNTELKILLINKVGISNLRNYVNTQHPRENFDKNIVIIKDYVKSGEFFCEKKYNCGKHFACVLLNRYYRYAQEVERMGSDDCD